MRLCVVELYSMDPVAAYQHGFVYIRQLAVELRQAITKKTKTVFQRIYNWQFVNCVQLWGALVIAHANTNKVVCTQLCEHAPSTKVSTASVDANDPGPDVVS